MGDAVPGHGRWTEIEIIDFVSENYMVLVPVLWVIGKFLKNTPKVKDWTIPWFMLILGIAGSLATSLNIELWDAVKQGILVAGVTVFANELIKQTTVERKID
jgi:hypothetical protein